MFSKKVLPIGLLTRRQLTIRYDPMCAKINREEVAIKSFVVNCGRISKPMRTIFGTERACNSGEYLDASFSKYEKSADLFKDYISFFCIVSVSTKRSCP